MELTPCVACDRHVSITEATCPFCGGGVAATMRRPSKLGRVSRAAIFAGAALATAACGKKAKQPDLKQQQQQTRTPDAGVDDPRDPNNPNNIPMPYGAPPARKRHV
jgi:hypothetical protein